MAEINVLPIAGIIFENVPPQLLNENEAHIFIGNTSDGISSHEFLSPVEKERSLRFVNEKDRNVYSLSHNMLRKIISLYTNENPSQIIFSINQCGKPYIGNSLIRFNLSHSNSSYIIGISKNEIGVDTEWINPGFEYKSVMQNYFSSYEQREILNSNSSHKSFFSFWSMKESLIKFLGHGITENLTKIDLTQKPCIAEVFEYPVLLSCFILNDYACAVTVPEKVSTIKFYKGIL